MFKLPTEYDVLVVGSGHAGIEAALAAARMGCRTLMLTQNLDTIGQMSCNPAVGGLAKGHIVREIDAMGGAMGLNADATGIQFRMLNKAKGPSVRAPRVQCDKKAYQFRMKAVLERAPNLDLKQATVSDVLVKDGAVSGVETDLGLMILARTVIMTSGTFLRGLLHVGENSKPGGRMADASSALSENLRRLDPRCGFVRTKRAQLFGREQINDSSRERIVRSDHCQINAVLFREVNEPRQIAGADRNVLGNLTRARVARRTENPVGMRRLPQFPCESVFTAPIANNEDLHRVK